MYLLINTSEKDIINLALFDEDKIEHKTYSGQNRELLSCIHKLFSAQGGSASGGKIRSKKFKVKDLGGIMVVVGTGGFTSTRLACVVANTFAYVLQIPLLAIKKDEVDKVQKLIKKLKVYPAKPGGRSRGQYISATYSGEPNITKKK